MIKCTKCGAKMTGDNKFGLCADCRRRPCVICGKEFVYYKAEQVTCRTHKYITDPIAYKERHGIPRSVSGHIEASAAWLVTAGMVAGWALSQFIGRVS